MIICRFQVIQTSRDALLSIFMLLEPYTISSPPCIESNLNLRWWEADKSQHKTNSTNQHLFFFPFKTMDESVILNVQYTG